ncbi:hypothetical protein ACFL5Q_05680 [Planctomycetota bacterium]
MLIRATMIAAAAAAAAVVGFSIWPELNHNSSGIAFADVQKQLAQVRSVAYLVRTERKGLELTAEKMMIRSDGQQRTEYAGGAWTVSNREQMVIVTVDPESKTVHTCYVLSWDANRAHDLINKIRSMHEKEDAAPADARDINGRSCPGFEIPEKNRLLKVWIDPDTRLPIYAERTIESWFQPIDVSKARKPWEAEPLDPERAVQDVMTRTWSDFEYDVELDAKLFDVTPPNGYVATTTGTPPSKRRPHPGEKLIVKRGVGIGDATFGMSKAEVVKLLGEPEEVDHETFDPKWRLKVPEGTNPKEIYEIVGEMEWDVLKYNTRGFWLTVRPVAGFAEIECFGNNFHGATVAVFPGRTSKGIGMGSPATDVIQKYGEKYAGTIEIENGLLHYDGKGVAFRDGGLTFRTYMGKVNYIRVSSGMGAAGYRRKRS